MNEIIDQTADYVLDLASPQRLAIPFKPLEKASMPIELATFVFQMLGVADRAAHAVPSVFRRLVASKCATVEPYGAWPAI